MYLLLTGVAFYLSLCGFLAKAGYSFWTGLIPIYNIALLFVFLGIKPIVLFILGILFIILPDGAIILTLLYVFLPFLISYAYGRGFFIGLLTFVCPIVMYPLLAFVLAVY